MTTNKEIINLIADVFELQKEFEVIANTEINALQAEIKELTEAVSTLTLMVKDLND